MKVSQSPFSNDHPLPATPCSSKTLPPFRAPRAPGHFTSYLLDQALSFPPRYFPIMVSLCFATLPRLLNGHQNHLACRNVRFVPQLISIFRLYYFALFPNRLASSDNLCGRYSLPLPHHRLGPSQVTKRSFGEGQPCRRAPDRKSRFERRQGWDIEDVGPDERTRCS
jgi:hypothetical protein